MCPSLHCLSSVLSLLVSVFLFFAPITDAAADPAPAAGFCGGAREGGHGRRGEWRRVLQIERGGGLVPSGGSGEIACPTHKHNDSGRSWRFVGKENDGEAGVMLGGNFCKGCRSGEERVKG